MQLTITGHHLEITTPLREYVENKFERLQRHFDKLDRQLIKHKQKHRGH